MGINGYILNLNIYQYIKAHLQSTQTHIDKNLLVSYLMEKYYIPHLNLKLLLWLFFFNIMSRIAKEVKTKRKQLDLGGKVKKIGKEKF